MKKSAGLFCSSNKFGQKDTGYLLNFLASAGYNSVSKIMPAFLKTLTPSAFQIGFVSSMYHLAKTLNTTYAGVLIDRVGKGKIIFYSFLALIPLVSLLFFANSILAFAALFFFIGLASNSFHIAINALSTLFTDKKAESLAKLEATYQVGFIVGPFIGGTLALYYGMPGAFYFWLFLTILNLVLARNLITKKNHSKTKKIKFIPTIKNFLSKHSMEFLVFIVLGGLIIGIIEGARDLLIPLYVIDVGLDLFAVGIIFTASALITALGIIPFGKISDKYGRKIPLVAAFTLTGLAFYLLPQTTSLIFIAILTGILSLGRTVGLTNTRAFAADITTTSTRATGLAMFELTFSLGRFIGPLASGLFLDFFSITTTFTIFLALSVLALVISLIYK